MASARLSLATLRTQLELDRPAEYLAQTPEGRLQPEAFEPNGFYGHAMVLKRYAGWSLKRPLPVLVQHGFYFYEGPVVSGGEREAFVPMALVPTPERAAIYQRKMKRPALAIGAPFLYAAAWLADHVVAWPDPGGTLVVPAHSTRYEKAEFDHVAFARQLAHLPEAFQPVRVCLFWRDVQDGCARPYREAGLAVVCMGHQQDPAFIDRLVVQLRLHARVITNALGSVIPMAIALNRPVIRLGGDLNLTYHVEKPGVKVTHGTVDEAREMLMRLFPSLNTGNPDPVIYEDQRAWAERYAGSQYVVSPERLNALLSAARHLDHLMPSGLLGNLSMRPAIANVLPLAWLRLRRMQKAFHPGWRF